MRKLLAVRHWLGILAAILFTMAAAANAAPVARPANLSLRLEIRGLPAITLSATGATVTVDETGGLGGMGQIALAAQAITLATPVLIAVTSTTSINSLTATTIDNLSGAFSIGGAGTNIPTTELPCPPPGSGVACVRQTGVGGVMGLSGTVNIWAGPVAVPVKLTFIQLGQGGNVAAPPLRFDAAPWTLNTGEVAFVTTSTYTTPQFFHTPGSSTFLVGTTTVTNTFTAIASQMGTIDQTGSRMTLVTPTWVDALGNILPVFSSFTIEFTDGQGLPIFVVPEPGELLLLGSGAGMLGMLVLMGRRRRR
jgi:hypothetical protein